MRIIITGACGHIGSHISENIDKIKKIKSTILLDNMESNRFSSMFNLKKKNNFKFYIKDLNDSRTLNEFKNVDYLIHCASMTNAANSFGNEKEMYKNNISCLKTVIKYCKKNNVKLIH